MYIMETHKKHIMTDKDSLFEGGGKRKSDIRHIKMSDKMQPGISMWKIIHFKQITLVLVVVKTADSVHSTGYTACTESPCLNTGQP